MNKNILFFSILVLAVFLPGCNNKKRPDGFPQLYPCEITVLQEGTPLSGATVMLLSEGGSVPWTVGGGTNDSGVARIFTHGEFAGAPLGQFQVWVSSLLQ